MLKFRQPAPFRRDMAGQPVMVQTKCCEFFQAAYIERQGSVQVVVRQVDFRNPSVRVDRHAVPRSKRVRAKPVRPDPPLLAAGAFVKGNQYFPVRFENGCRIRGGRQSAFRGDGIWDAGGLRSNGWLRLCLRLRWRPGGGTILAAGNQQE